MSNFTSLVRQMKKSETLGGNEIKLATDGTRVEPKPPLIHTTKWTQYRLRLNKAADLDIDLKFRDAASEGARYTVNIKAAVTLSSDPERQRSMLLMIHSQEGWTDQLSTRINRAIKEWRKQHHANLRPLPAILASRSNRGNGMSSLENAVNSALREAGLDTELVRILPRAVLNRTPISLDEKGLEARLSDHDKRISFNVTGELIPDSKSDAFFLEWKKNNNERVRKKDIRQDVLEAIKTAIGGTQLQEWRTGSEMLQALAREEAQTAAERYGWKLSKGLLIRSDQETAILRENFSFDQTYELPGSGRKLTVGHSGTYQLDNAALYEQMRKADPDSKDFLKFIEVQARAVTERKLRTRDYSAAIGLLNDSSTFEDEIRGDLSLIIKKYGHHCTSCHLVMKDLPELPLLRPKGMQKQIFADQNFALATPGRKVKLGLRGRLRLEELKRFEEAVTPADNTVDAIVKKVAGTAIEATQSYLSSIDPADYNGSDFMLARVLVEDLIEKAADVFGDTKDVKTKALVLPLLDRIADEVREVYGITLTELTIDRGEEDISKRALTLTGYKGKIHVGNVPMRSELTAAIVTVNITCAYTIKGISGNYRKAFTDTTLTSETEVIQIEKLEEELHDNITNVLKEAPIEFLRGAPQQNFIWVLGEILKGTAMIGHGLEISVPPISFKTDLPPVQYSNLTNKAIETLQKAETRHLELLDSLGENLMDDDEIEEQIEKVENRIKRIQEKVNESRDRERAIDRNAEARFAEKHVGESIMATIRAMKLPERAVVAIDSRVKTMLLSGPNAATEETEEEVVSEIIDTEFDDIDGDSAESPIKDNDFPDDDFVGVEDDED